MLVAKFHHMGTQIFKGEERLIDIMQQIAKKILGGTETCEN